MIEQNVALCLALLGLFGLLWYGNRDEKRPHGGDHGALDDGESREANPSRSNTDANI